MSKKQISRFRRYFRRTLYTLAALSFVFFLTMVYIRIDDRLRYSLAKEYTVEIFQIDVLTQEALAFWQDEDDKHETASRLLRNGFFSPIYTKSGLEMMRENAESGYAPSQHYYAHVLYRNFPTDENKAIAIAYYEASAVQGYAPSIKTLEQLAKPQH